MSEDIFEIINETLVNIENLNIPIKFKGDQLHATEFNSVVSKINELKEQLNNPVKETFNITTAYILDKIENAKISLIAENVKLHEGSSRSILDELEDIQYHLNSTENRSIDNATRIQDITSYINSISETLGIVNDKITTMETDVDEKIETSYNKSIEESKKYTDEEVEKSYTTLYTHINDTTLTFDYDIKTEPEPASPKMIYDNEDDLYDGSYHS